MKFECGKGWFSVNGCKAETEKGEKYLIRMRKDASVKIVVMKRLSDEPLFEFVRDV